MAQKGRHTFTIALTTAIPVVGSRGRHGIQSTSGDRKKGRDRGLQSREQSVCGRIGGRKIPPSVHYVSIKSGVAGGKEGKTRFERLLNFEVWGYSGEVDYFGGDKIVV